MDSVILYLVLVQSVTCISSVTVSTPAMQRKNTGESCTFLWNVTGNFENYTIKLLSTGSTTALGPNTNHSLNRNRGVVTLFIWNIQTSNAGYYTLSVSTGPSTNVNSVTTLFVYAAAHTYTILAVGRSPIFEGDKIELNCSGSSASFPVEYQTKMYYTWQNNWYGSFRNTSSGPAVLQNGDPLPGYSFKNEGKTLVIASAQFPDSAHTCYVQEEGSPQRSIISYSNSLVIYSRPYTYSISPISLKFNAALYSYVYLYFSVQSNPRLTSYTNWSFVSASGSTKEYPLLDSNPLVSAYVPLSFMLNSNNSYGNYSVTLTNSNGSTTETFQVLAPGPPDNPSKFSLQFVTQSAVSLQWRCMWFNGAQQTVFVRLAGVRNEDEVDIKAAALATDCFNSVYSTIFQNNIWPETDYEASIWSTNTYGSSDVVKLAVRTPKRLIFDTSPANISIMGSQAAVDFRITDSTMTMLRLNLTCCVESETQCSDQSYIITNTSKHIVFDRLPAAGSEYVFDFTVYYTDGYTYEATLAILKGVRVSSTDEPTKSLRNCVEKGDSPVVAVIVLAVLLGVAAVALISCVIVFLVAKRRQKNSHQQPTATLQPSAPNRSQPERKEPSDYVNEEEHYESMVDVNPTQDDANYTALEETSSRAKANIGHVKLHSMDNVDEDMTSIGPTCRGVMDRGQLRSVFVHISKDDRRGKPMQMMKFNRSQPLF